MNRLIKTKRGNDLGSRVRYQIPPLRAVFHGTITDIQSLDNGDERIEILTASREGANYIWIDEKHIMGIDHV